MIRLNIDMKVRLLTSIKDGYINNETETLLRQLMDVQTIEIQVVNKREDLEYYKEYEAFKIQYEALKKQKK